MSELQKVAAGAMAMPSRVNAGIGGQTKDIAFGDGSDSSWVNWRDLSDETRRRLSALSPGSRCLAAQFDVPSAVYVLGDIWVRDITGWMLTDLHFIMLTVRQRARYNQAAQWAFGEITAAAQRWVVMPGSIREDRGALTPDHLAGTPVSTGAAHGDGSAPAHLGDAEFLPYGVREQLVRFVPEPTYADSVIWQTSSAANVPIDQVVRVVRETAARVIAVDASRSIEILDSDTSVSAAHRLSDSAWTVSVFRATLSTREDLVIGGSGSASIVRTQVGW